MILYAKPAATLLKNEILRQAQRFVSQAGRKPKLVVLQVGDDPASAVYIRQKEKSAQETGIESETVRFPADITPEILRARVQLLNQDKTVDGILIQRPLPLAFSEEAVSYWVLSEKDVDAFHPSNVGRLSLGLDCLKSCTPLGILELLKFYKIPVTGCLACVVGRSTIVGKPMAAMLLQESATVIQCHSKTRDLPSLTRQADLLIVAAGKQGLIGREHVRPGQTVIDVGIHRGGDGKLSGDVRFDDVLPIVSAITPVPGGVGPMTICGLLLNTIKAAQENRKE